MHLRGDSLQRFVIIDGRQAPPAHNIKEYFIMKNLLRKKHLFLNIPLLLSLFLLSGCIIDSNKDDRTELYPLEFVFSMNDAVINGDVASVQFTTGAVTPNVVDNGAVLAYFREQGTWTAMPYTFGIESPDLLAVDYTITMGYGYDDGLIEVFYEASTPEAPLIDQPDRRIKAVVLEDLSYVRKANIDLNDYEAVKKYLKLKD